MNAIYYHNYDPLSLDGTRERPNRYLVSIGYSQPVTNEAVLVANVYRETLRERTQAQNIVQLGCATSSTREPFFLEASAPIR